MWRILWQEIVCFLGHLGPELRIFALDGPGAFQDAAIGEAGHMAFLRLGGALISFGMFALFWLATRRIIGIEALVVAFEEFFLGSARCVALLRLGTWVGVAPGRGTTLPARIVRVAAELAPGGT